MFLHLGQNVAINTSSIIGVFDMDNCTIGNISRNYLSQAELNKKVVNVSSELPKSFVVCQADDGSEKVFISPLSSTTLAKRQVSKSLLCPFRRSL